MKRQTTMRRARGFSLVEVLVAVIVTSVGLLGVAKIQALALSGTGTARTRSMAAFAAADLAATMHADRAYWAQLAGDPAVRIDVANAAISSLDPALLSVPLNGCVLHSPCTDFVQIAAQDLRDWATELQSTLAGSSNPNATVNCRIQAGNPATCAIRIFWNEHVISTPYSTNTLGGAQQAVQAAQAVEQTSYTLYTEP